MFICRSERTGTLAAMLLLAAALCVVLTMAAHDEGSSAESTTFDSGGMTYTVTEGSAELTSPNNKNLVSCTIPSSVSYG